MTNVTHDEKSLKDAGARVRGAPRCPVCGAVGCPLAPDSDDSLGLPELRRAAEWSPKGKRGLELFTDSMWKLNAEVVVRMLDLARLHRRQDKAQSIDEDRRLRAHLDHADARLVEAVLIREQARATRKAPTTRSHVARSSPSSSRRTTMPIHLLHCERCGANWSPKVPDPVACPRCHSPRWRTPSRFSKSTNPPPAAPAAAREEN